MYRFNRAASVLLIASLFAGIALADVVTINGGALQDNTVSPAKFQRTGSAPADNQALIYDNTTGLFKWGASLSTIADNSVESAKLVTDNTGSWTAPGKIVVPIGADNMSSISGSVNAGTVTCPESGWMLYQASDNTMHICIAGVDNTISLGAGTAPPVDNSTVYDFAGSTLDNTTFIYQVASTGAISQNNQVSLSSGANVTGEFLMAYRTEIVPTDNAVYKINASVGTGAAGNYFMRLEMQNDLPQLSNHDDANYLMFSGITLNGNSTIYYRNNLNAEIEGDMIGSGTFTADTLYQWYLETNSTQWRMRLVSTDGQTEYLNSGWINWSATKSTSGAHLWLILGVEPYATGQANVIVDRFEIQQ